MFSNPFRRFDRDDGALGQSNRHLERIYKARMLLTCDLLGAAMGWAAKYGREMDVAEARAYIEKHGWSDWRWAVVDRLPPASQTVKEIPPRFYDRLYDWRELEQLEDPDEFWIHRLSSVKHYLEGILYEKLGALKAWREIVRKHDPRFCDIAEEIQTHDLDKFRPDALRVSTKRLTNWHAPQMPYDHPSYPGPVPRRPSVDRPPAETPDELAEFPERPEAVHEVPERPEGTLENNGQGMDLEEKSNDLEKTISETTRETTTSKIYTLRDDFENNI